MPNKMFDRRTSNEYCDRFVEAQITNNHTLITPEESNLAIVAKSSSLKLVQEGIVIATWNVRALYACGEVKELTHELARYPWDILGLAEVRWTGTGETMAEDGFTIWYSREDTSICMALVLWSTQIN